MLWIAVIILAISTAGLLWYWWRERRSTERLRRESRRRLSELKGKHDRRVGRIKRRLDEQQRLGHLAFVEDLLPTLDSLGHALEAARNEADADDLLEGLEMLARQLDSLLSSYGVERIAPEPGDVFDPRLHEAVRVVEDDDRDTGRIASCLRPGYAHGDRVLRAACVAITAAPDDEVDLGDMEPTADDQREEDTSSEESVSDDSVGSSTRP
ncbi:MAG: nucleotide exchange factor GrpE [Persicimonas sp.]